MLSVAVYDEAGDAIGLGPDDAAEVFIDFREGLAELECLGDAADEEVQIEVLAAA